MTLAFLRGANRNVLIGTAVVLALLLPSSPLGQAIVALGIPALLGARIGKLLGTDRWANKLRILVELAVGFASFGLVGSVFSVIAQHLGVARPLDGAPITSFWIVVVLALTSTSRWGGSPATWRLAALRPRHPLGYLAYAGPPLALAGSYRLNIGGSATLAYLALLLAIATLLLAAGLPDRRQLLARPVAIALAVTTMGWQFPGRGGVMWGTDNVVEWYFARMAIHQGGFPLTGTSNPYAGMLSVTSIPAQLHGLTGLGPVTFLQLSPGIWLGLLAAVGYLVARRFLSPAASVVVTAVLVFANETYLRTIPTVPRQAAAMVPFALIVLVVVRQPLPTKDARRVIAALGICTALLHYSTAYLALGFLLGGWIVSKVVKGRSAVSPIGGTSLLATLAGVVLWDGWVAHGGSGLRSLLHDFSKHGIELLPGSGNLLHRWIASIQATRSVSASTLRLLDLAWRGQLGRQIQPYPAALRTKLVDDPPPVPRPLSPVDLSHADFILSTLIAELAVFAIAVLVIIALRRRARAFPAPELIGMATFGLLVELATRFSGTLAMQFAPDRVRLQLSVVLVGLLGASWQCLRPNGERAAARQWARLRGATMVLLVAFTLVTATRVAAPLIGGTRSAALTAGNSMDLYQFGVTPASFDMASWVARHASRGSLINVQPSSYFLVASATGPDRAGTIRSLDPVLLDRRAWVVATYPNVVDGRAEGRVGPSVAWYRFTERFIAKRWSRVYVGPGYAVYR